MAYGARLESVLGESPRGFESPILRQTQSFGTAVDEQPLRPHRHLLTRGVAAILAFFVPAFGVIYALTVPNGPWEYVLVGQLLVSLAFWYAVFAYLRLGVWVSADGIAERGFFSITRRYRRDEVGSVLLAHTFHGGGVETVPQLFVRHPAGARLIRLRGQFWSRESMQAVLETLDVPVTELDGPLSMVELEEAYPGLLYWFERRPRLTALLFGGLLAVCGLVLYMVLAALGETATAS